MPASTHALRTYFVFILSMTLMSCRMSSCASPDDDKGPVLPKDKVVRLPTPVGFGASAGARRQAIDLPTPPGIGHHATNSASGEEAGLPQDTPTPGVDVEVEADPDIGRLPLTVRFNAVVSGEVGGASYEWIFDDGSPPTHGQTVTHMYNQPGSFTARLVVTLPSGQRVVKDTPIQVDDAAEPADTE